MLRCVLGGLQAYNGELDHARYVRVSHKVQSAKSASCRENARHFATDWPKLLLRQ
jgi:hypothetical protein